MYKKVLTVLMTVLASSQMAQAATVVWELDNAHTNVGFSVRHMMVSHVHGTFKNATGTLKVDDKDLSKSSAEFALAVKDIDTGNDKRDTHLKSPEFFDEAKFATITFKSAKVDKVRKGLKVHGFVTIHGVTRPLVMEVTGPSKIIRDPFGLYRSAVSAKAKVNRKDFGLTWNQALEAGGVAVGEEVEISIDAEFIRKDTAEAVVTPHVQAGEPAPTKTE